MINIYVFHHNNLYGRPMYYYSDDELKQSLKAMFDSDSENLTDDIKNDIKNALVYKVGTYSPVKGKITNTFTKKFLGVVKDLIKE